MLFRVRDKDASNRCIRGRMLPSFTAIAAGVTVFSLVSFAPVTVNLGGTVFDLVAPAAALARSGRGGGRDGSKGGHSKGGRGNNTGGTNQNNQSGPSGTGGGTSAGGTDGGTSAGGTGGGTGGGGTGGGTGGGGTDGSTGGGGTDGGTGGGGTDGSTGGGGTDGGTGGGGTDGSTGGGGTDGSTGGGGTGGGTAGGNNGGPGKDATSSRDGDRENKQLQPTVPTVAVAVFTTAIKKRYPANDVELLEDPQQAVSFFNELHAMAGKRITHRWVHGGSVKFEANFDVMAQRWRVWSTQLLPADLAGEWTVEIVDEDGNVLESHSISYQPKDPEFLAMR